MLQKDYEETSRTSIFHEYRTSGDLLTFHIRKGFYGFQVRYKIVVAIEPMTNLGTHKIRQHADGWTITTLDNKPSAHFEHDVAIVNGKPELLSTFKYINEALGIVSDEEEEFRQ